MTYSEKQKTAILKSLLYIVDADGIRSTQEICFLRWFSINNDEKLEDIMERAKFMTYDDMKDTIHNLDEEGFEEVTRLWYICSLSDGIVPEELKVIIDLARNGEPSIPNKSLNKEDIKYIIDTYDYEEAPILPSMDFLTRYYHPNLKLDDRTLEDQFFSSRELLETIEIFGFSQEEFWLLVLFVKDVVEEKCKSAITLPESTVDAIRSIRDAIGNLPLHPSCREFSPDDELPDDAYIKFDNPIELTIRSGKKRVLKCDNDQAVYLLAHACSHLLRDHSIDTLHMNQHQAKISPTRKLAMFYVVMKKFLQDKSREVEDFKGRDNKNLLIAQVLHAIGWLDEKYATLYTENDVPNNSFYDLVKKYIKAPCKGINFSSIYYQGVKVEN